MDSTMIITIIVLLILLGLYLYNRNKPAPRGTYDDKDHRSSGSIGGGTRAYDDKDHRSSGSIGGGERAYDSPEHKSSGSIGGDNRSERRTSTNRESVTTNKERPKHDDERFKSGGSFGSK